MDSQNALLFSPQNKNEVYLLKMKPRTETKEMTKRVIPFHVLENSYAAYNHVQHVTPILPLRPTGSTEINHALCEPTNLVNLLQVKMDRNFQNHINTSFTNPFQMSSLKLIQRSSQAEVKQNSFKNSTSDSIERQCNYISVSDRVVPPRAVAVLPTALRIRRGSVTPRRFLPPRVRFGPIQGIKRPVSVTKTTEIILNAASNKTPIFLLKHNDNSLMHMDVSDKDKSNWFCLLPLGNEDTANVWIYEEDNELYGITTESIPPRKPLTLGYSKSYTQDYGLPKGQPVLDLHEASTIQKEWWCFVCRKPMATDILLQQHIDIHHKDDVTASRRRYYHCRHCKRKFCRRYTLKRHLMSRFCLKNSKQSQDKQHSEEPPDVGINITQSTDDSRMPSDESFQNYSNGLDFSTNLFDDRMPGLDISGNSRGENDFIPYTIDREENLVTDLGFINGLDCQNAPLEVHTLDNSTPHQDCLELPLVSSQTHTRKKKKKQQNIEARRFQCQCGRVFNSKERFTKHIYTVCLAGHTSKPITGLPCETKYKCEQCELNFKRRGMLVNHLWRVHQSASTSVPLEKRIRHYPCVICPKIYSTAAKRNHHVRIHHPEATSVRPAPIEGGVVMSSPASCGECPRQYCTRAKLLQHVRAAHPHLLASSQHTNM